MATSPGFLRLASNAARALAETALDGLPDAVLVVDARHRHLPIILANAAASGALTPLEGRAGSLLESPLQRALGAASWAALESLLAQLSGPTSLSLEWALGTGLGHRPTRVAPLAGEPAQRWVMLSFDPEGTDARGDAGGAGDARLDPDTGARRREVPPAVPDPRALIATGDARVFYPSLEALTRHARDLIFVVAADGSLRYVSAGIRNVLGLEYEQFPADSRASLFSLLHPDEQEAARAGVAALAAGLRPAFIRQHRFKHCDGSWRWLECSFSTALEDSRLAGVIVNASDISDRRLAESRLAQREEVFRLVSEAVDGIIYEWDLVHGTARRSRGMFEVLGVEPRESVDAWRDHIHPMDLDASRRAVNLALLKGGGWAVNYRIRDARGIYRSFLDRGVIVRDANQDPVSAIGCCVDVSEIRRITDLLAETQRAANIGGWEFSHITQELIWTDEMFRIYEATPAEFSLSWQAMLARCVPESLQRLQDACERARATGAQVDLELEITTLKNRRIWVRWLGHFEILDGKPARAYGSVQNIEAQKAARTALESSTSWLKLSMNIAHMYAWRWDRARDAFEFAVLDGRQRHLPTVFPSMKRMLVRTHPADRAALKRGLDDAFEQHMEVQREFRLEMRSGRYRWYAAIARPLFGEGGEPKGLVGIIQDVTLRRESEARLRRSEELLRVITATTGDTLLLLDADLKVRFINKSFGGRPVQQIIGRGVQELLPVPVREGVAEKLRHLLTTGETSNYEFELNRNFDQRFFEARALLVRDDSLGTCISISMRDVTERKRLEQEIVEVSGRERRSIGRDLHDGLGQELTGIALMLRGLASRVKVRCPEVSDHADEIVVLVNRSIENARGLARGLMPVQAETGGLVAALRELSTRSRDLYGLEVRFRAKTLAQLTLDETNSNHLYRIAQEAVTNASRHGRAKVVDIFLRVNPGNFLLRITDDGEGFRPPTSPYTGMGLKIMRYRAGRMGARFEIYPTKPHGTVVRVVGEQPLALEGESGRQSKESN